MGSLRATLVLAASLLASTLLVSPALSNSELSQAIEKDYNDHLGSLFDYFHRNPELSLMEVNTSARLAKELREAGFEVTEGIAKTGLIAIMKNGPGPMVMVRADMDALPVKEKSGLPNASTVEQIDWNGNLVPVMHACGHDTHITGLVGTARQMAARRDEWSGTLMLLGQPDEEYIGGANVMMKEGIWDRFGKPDYALAYHVQSALPVGSLEAVLGSPFSGADSIDIIVHGRGAHGAYPHRSIDPIVLSSQIVLALQTLVSRTLSPHEAGLVTVGAINGGTAHNVIPDQVHLKLTVRNDSLETRKTLIDGIKRIAENMGRAAGLPEDKLPEVIVATTGVPPTVNDIPLTKRLRAVWSAELGSDVFKEIKRLGMGAEDFPFFTTDPYIPSTYFRVGGTPPEAFEREAAGGEPVAAQHSPLFKVDAEAVVRLGVEATVLALKELLQAE